MKIIYQKIKGRVQLISAGALMIVLTGCGSLDFSKNLIRKNWLSEEKSSGKPMVTAKAFLLPAKKSTPLPYMQDLQFARQQLHQQNYKAAEHYFKKTLVQAPEQSDALNLLPWTYFYQKKYDLALLAFERNHTAYRKDPSPVLGMAWCYVSMNQYKQALDTFALAEKLSPESYEVHKGRAVVYLKQKNLALAVPELQKIFNPREVQQMLSFWQTAHEDSPDVPLPVVSHAVGTLSLFALPVEHPRYRSILWHLNQPENSAIEDAWKYYRNRFYRRALQAFQDLPEPLSQSLDARTGLAWSYLKTNKILEAEEVFQTIAITFPNFSGLVEGVKEVHRLKMKKAAFAQYYLDMNKLGIAEKKFRELAEKFPHWSHPQTQLGMVELKKGEHESARNYFQKALALEPGSQTALRGMEVVQKTLEPDLYEANQAFNKGNFKEAARLYYDYIEAQRPIQRLNKPLAEAFNGLGWSQLEKGQYWEALEKFKQAQKHPAFKSDAAKGMGTAFFELEKYNDAVVYLKIAKTGHPDQRQIDYKLDWSLMHGWQANRARRYFERELQSDPLRASLYMGLGWTHYRLNDPDMAVELFLKAISLDPDAVLSDELLFFADNQRFGWQVYNKLGWAFFKERSYEKSIAMFEASLNKQPNKSEAQKGIGYNRFRLGQFELAIESLKQALAINPDSSGVTETVYNAKGEGLFGIQTTVRTKLARAHYQLKNYREAIRYYQDELRRQPQQPDAYDGLGWVYLQLHRLNESRAAFIRSLNLEPLNSHSNKGLSQVKQLLATQNIRIKRPTFLPVSSQFMPEKS